MQAGAICAGFFYELKGVRFVLLNVTGKYATAFLSTLILFSGCGLRLEVMKRQHRAGYTIDLHQKQKRNHSTDPSKPRQSTVHSKPNRASKLHQPVPSNSTEPVKSLYVTAVPGDAVCNITTEDKRTSGKETHRRENKTKRTFENNAGPAEVKPTVPPDEEPVDLTHHPMAGGMLVASAVLLGTALILYATGFAVPLIFFALLGSLLLGASTFMLAKKHFTYSEGTTENERNAKDLLSVLLFSLYYFLTFLSLLVIAFWLYLIYGLRLL
jgi:hypothetical protein